MYYLTMLSTGGEWCILKHQYRYTYLHINTVDSLIFGVYR